MNLDKLVSAKMERRNFLKTCLLALGGVLLARWLKPFGAEEKPGMVEAKFYRSSDNLPG